MDPTSCPLPEVAAALSPFIKPRDEVISIRRNLHAYLQKHLPLDDDTPLASVNLTTPLQETLPDPPPRLTGVRKAYWKALQAHRAAQAKHEALRAELESLKRPGHGSATPSPTNINETYIPLLRQKETHRRLQVLSKTYSSLPSPSSGTLEDQLKSNLPPAPTPPSSQPPSSSIPSKTSPDVDEKLLALKKVVLETKCRVDDRSARNAVARASLPGPEELGPAAKVVGLQAALQELTGWMEEQLTIIATAEAEGAGTSVPPNRDGGEGRKPDFEAIEADYERYLDARQRLIATLNSPSSDSDSPDESPLFPPPSITAPRTNKPSPAENLLPRIPALTSLKSTEAALLQQTAYIRRQLASSEEETARTLQRLAGESHLVDPAASRGKDWAESSRESGREADEVVTQRVKAALAFAGQAGDLLHGLDVQGS